MPWQPLQGNHGCGWGPIQIQPNEDIKVFKKHQESDRFYTLLLSMLKTIDKRSIKIRTVSNVETFPFVHRSVSQTYFVSNLIFDIAMVTISVGPIQFHLNEDIQVQATNK